MSKLFTAVKIGPIELRNRTIRAAAYESMCDNNSPSEQLKNYHLSVAQGGIGMTTIAYAAVCRSGLSFKKQLWMRDEIVGDLRTLTDKIHATGAKASIQLGHCGNMSHKNIANQLPISASNGFNLYSPTFYRGMSVGEIEQMVEHFGNAVTLAKKAGFDAVEIHAGHGYLISQFLSPYTNRRKDNFGGSLANRMRFMKMVITRVLEAAGSELAVIVKVNMRDGFKGGMEVDDCIEVARELENMGVHALILSGGFVSRAPMYVMHGQMPIRSMTKYMSPWWLKLGIKMGGGAMIKGEPFKEGYFLENALRFRAALKVPLIYVGGAVSRAKIDEILNHNFQCVAMARALVCAPDFVAQMENGVEHCGCNHSNYCIARMYSRDMKCHKSIDKLPRKIVDEIKKLENE